MLEMGPNDQSAVVVFGGEALVERPLSPSKTLEGFTSKVTSLQTDLAEAIRLGMALLPVDTARRMVILSDGIQTTGDAAEAARLADLLLEQGIYVIGFSYPVVPHGKARIRTQMSAAHTTEDVNRAVDAFVAARAKM